MNQIKLKSAAEVLKARMKKHRQELKTFNFSFQKWSKEIAALRPEYAESENAIHLYNVWYGRVADVELTEDTAEILRVLESK